MTHKVIVIIVFFVHTHTHTHTFGDLVPFVYLLDFMLDVKSIEEKKIYSLQ